MLKSVEYSVEFPTTGRVFTNVIEFEPGLTAITGPNEAGKSLVMEMITYAKFGKEALRGPASDYRNLECRLVEEIGGHEWVLDRRPRSETFTIDGEVVAVGADAINKEVPNRLGYGLDVFNIAHAAQQGDLEALTSLRPTARRQMIDKLVGLDLLESVERSCKDEARALNTLAQSMAVDIVEPVEPEPPEGYEPVPVLEQKIEEMQAQELERQRLEAIPEPVEPTKPEAPAETDVEALEQYEAERQECLKARAFLEGQLAGLPEPTTTLENLEKGVAWKHYQEEISRRGPQPEYPLAALEEWQETWNRKRILEGTTSVSCPKCTHEFLTEQPDVDLDQVRNLPDPPLSESDINRQKRRHELWAEPLTVCEEVVIHNMEQEIFAHANADSRADLLNKLGALPFHTDRSRELAVARNYQREIAVYTDRQNRYNQELAAYRDARASLEGIQNKADDLQELKLLLGTSKAYEVSHSQFILQRDHTRKQQLKLKQYTDQAEDYLSGAGCLSKTRLRVKRELAPSLAVASSAILSGMTNGERRHIDIDEDFNITVDGQAVRTLSGSGKSVVNLALRIGLGQILTSKILPVFMGDEIDAAMDSNRVGATHETLQALRDYLAQIIIITHKPDFVADQKIELIS